jgi:hypothetical protein
MQWIMTWSVELQVLAARSKLLKSYSSTLTLRVCRGWNEMVGFQGGDVVTGQLIMMFVYSVVIFFVVNVLVN